MTNQEAPSLQQALADALRRIRQEHEWTQDVVAERARVWGLAWTRSTVSDLEAQPRRRDLSVDEFVLLDQVLDADLASRIYQHVKDLRLGEPGAHPTALAWYIAPQVPLSETPQLEMDAWDARIEAVKTSSKSNLANFKAARERERVMSLRRPERNVARALNVEPRKVARAALERWGHGVTEERDRRVEEARGEGDKSRRRSHATRQIITEIREELGGKP